MKQLISVRSNTHYAEREEAEKFELLPVMELVLIYTDGKDYKVVKDELKPTNKLSEVRISIDPFSLESLITNLQLHQEKLKRARDNADKLNALVKHINNKP